MDHKQLGCAVAVAAGAIFPGSAVAGDCDVIPNFPLMGYNTSGTTTYNAGNDLFAVDGSPTNIRFIPAAMPVPVEATGMPPALSIAINVLIDDSGALIGGVPGDDLVVLGQIDEDGDTVPDYVGVLLTGEVTQFCFIDNPPVATAFGRVGNENPRFGEAKDEKDDARLLGVPLSTDEYDLRFEVTGGALAPLYAGRPIGVTVTSEMSSFGGDFTVNFDGEAKGNCAPIGTLGACCFSDNSCALRLEEDCDAEGGLWQGPFTTCGDVECTEGGACCLAGGGCGPAFEDECVAMVGEFQGPGTGCTPAMLGEAGTYRLGNHPASNFAPPPYGLRWDELFDVTAGNDRFTFDFDAPGTAMFLDYDGAGTIRIFGTAFGGLDVGNGHDPAWTSFAEIDVTYTNVINVPGDDDLQRLDEGAIVGTLTWLDTMDVFDIIEKPSPAGRTFRFGNEDDDLGHRGFAGLSGWGWIMSAGNFGDWLFTARDLCEPGCNIIVDLEACVIPPPPGPPGDACDGKVLELRLRYTGENCDATVHGQDADKVDCMGDANLTEPVRVLVTNNGGSEVYADVSGVMLGDLVTATAANAGASDFASETQVRIFDGNGDEIQFLRFHTSCSQPLAPGYQFGSLFLESMVTTEGGEVSVPDPDPDECITEFVLGGGPGCEGKVLSLDLLYVGGDCTQTMHTQDPSKVDCMGDAALVEPVRILVTDNGGDEVYLDVDGVMLGDVVTASAANAGENDFSSETHVRIFDGNGDEIQFLRFHTSCSQPLNNGNQFGAIRIFGMNTTEGGQSMLGVEVEYTYTITNLGGDTVFDVMVNDSFGLVPGSPIPSIGPGETVVLMQTLVITDTTVNVVTVTGNGDPTTCEAMAEAEVIAVEPPQDCCAFGKPRVLTMLYTGDDCSATSHTQDPSKVDCEDLVAMLPDMVYIVANEKFDDPEDEPIFFAGFVSAGDTFDIDALLGGENHLKSNTAIHIFDAPGGMLLQRAEFHTSCSQPLFEGDQFGASLLVDCVGEDEPIPGGSSCCFDGEKPRALVMEYTGDDCSETMHFQDPDKVECEDFAPLIDMVHIVANDKDNAASGKIWFSGPVAVGTMFTIDALNADEDKLKSRTYVHIFAAPGGQLLQRVEFHTSCSQPITIGDQYGASTLLECIGENAPLPASQGVTKGDGPLGTAGSIDVNAVIAAWGPCPADCPEDLDGDGVVGISDLELVLGR